MKDLEANGIPHDLALYLLSHSPEYRELIRQRVHEAQKRRMKWDASTEYYRERWMQSRGIDIDLLGREIEGCG